MELHTNTEREEVPVDEPDEGTTAEVSADAASKTKSENSQATSTPSDNHIYAAPPCVLDLETQCSVCYDIAKSDYRSRGGTPPESGCPHCVLIPLPALRQSAQESDCQICHVFWVALTLFVKSADEDVMTRATLEIWEGRWCIDVTLRNEAPVPNSRITSCREYCFAHDIIVPSVYSALLFVSSGDILQRWFSRTLPQANLIQKHTDSAASHVIMRAWLSDCLQEHDDCKTLASSFRTNVPDRLVHIASQSCVRLSTRHSPHTPYLALSYCWGVTDIFSTTNENFREHLEGMSVSKLPKTFRHALVITQALGYEYIWIDSLCIIQGDPGDFVRQSGQMGDIYSNADLVLSADLAKDVHQGFLHERTQASFAIKMPMSKCKQSKPRQPQNETQSIRSEDSCHKERHAADDIEAIFVNPMHKMPFFFKTSPTCERAWCFQEQHLAHRVIRFTEGSMYWKCRAHSRCECGAKDDGNHMHEVHDISIRGPLEDYANSEETSLMASINYWSVDVVEEYSGRRLTNPTDRLPAIAGIASRLQSPKLGAYHAGLWENSLPCALLWTTGFSVVMQEAHAYIGPTWSWVSSRNNVRYQRGRLIDLAKVLQIRTHLESSETYGPIRAAWIRLSGLLRRVNIAQYTLCGLILPGGTRAKLKVCQKGERVPRTRVIWDLTQYKLEEPTSDTLSDFYLLLIAKMRHGNVNTFQGLVLIKSPKQPGAFERIGMFEAEHQMGHGWKRKAVTII